MSGFLPVFDVFSQRQESCHTCPLSSVTSYGFGQLPALLLMGNSHSEMKGPIVPDDCEPHSCQQSFHRNGLRLGDSGGTPHHPVTALLGQSFLHQSSRGRSQLGSQALEVKSLHLEVMPSRSAHLPWTKTSHMTMPNSHGQGRAVCLEGEESWVLAKAGNAATGEFLGSSNESRGCAGYLARLLQVNQSSVIPAATRKSLFPEGRRLQWKD